MYCEIANMILELCMFYYFNSMHKPRIILGMGSANERRRYNVTWSLIGWAHTQNDPCKQTRIEGNDKQQLNKDSMGWLQ